MNMTEVQLIENVSIGAVAVVPIILALIQAFKMIGLPSKYAPIASIGLGIVVGFIFRHDTQDLSQTILAGVLYGLSASGLFSGIKTTAHAQQAENTNNNGTGGTSI